VIVNKPKSFLEISSCSANHHGCEYFGRVCFAVPAASRPDSSYSMLTPYIAIAVQTYLLQRCHCHRKIDNRLLSLVP